MPCLVRDVRGVPKEAVVVKGPMKRRVLAVATGMTAMALAVGLAIVPGATGDTLPIVVGGFRPEAPDVSGGRVVWADDMYGSYDIFMYDSATGTTERLTTDLADETQPSISGDIVVYTRNGPDGTDIYYYDISTSSVGIVTNAQRDQVSPTISGTYVAWEDRASGFLPQIWARDLAGGAPKKVSSGYGAAFKRPRAGGDWVVYEAYMSGTGGDSDVHAYNFATSQKVVVASGEQQEVVPTTDGRYVVWAEGAEGGMDIKGYDLQTSSAFDVRVQPGEQTFPVVAGGTVYWIDSGGPSRLHVDTYEIATKTFEPFDNYSTSEMMGVAADGQDLVWLEPTGDGTWQVRALLPGVGGASTTAIGDILPASPAWLPFRLAQISTAGDLDPPEVVETTVEPGETEVDADSDLTVYFSEPLDARSVDGAVTLETADGDPVDADVSYSALSRAVSVKPSEPLDDGTYVLSVDGAVTDKVGNALGDEYVVAFSTVGTFADTQKPTKPGNPLTRVDGLSNVELSWNPSSDASGIAEYRVYRYWEPIDSSNLSSASLVTTVSGTATTCTVAAKSTAVTEKNAKYTYYYALTAKDPSGNISDISNNIAPDPHGTYVYGSNTNTCAMCHIVHGSPPTGRWSLGAKSAESCYVCHGNTAMTTAYGHGSTYNTQARFWDYSSDPLPTGGSKHRNSYMTSVREDCDACHTAHRKPYDQLATGTKDPDTSYSKLLKSPSDPSTATSSLLYSTDTTPFAEPFCFACHGSNSGGTLTYMTDKGGISAYSNTAGDHNESAYSGTSVAHGDSNVYATTRSSSDPGPEINCTACHNEHASPVTRLIDYRQSNTSTASYDQSGLCYACHSNSSGESDATGSAPFSWNSRDVKAQFSKSSHHPITAGAGGGNPLLGTQEEGISTAFAGTHTNTVSTSSTGSVVLSPGSAPYSTTGTYTSTPVTPTANLMGWTSVRVNGAENGGTLTIDVLDQSDSVVVSSVPLNTDYSLASVPTTVTHLKVRAKFTGNGSVTPSLDDWTIDYAHISTTSTPSLTCYNCHNTHYVEKGSGAWDMDRVSDPNDTQGKYSGTPTEFCTECHDGSLPNTWVSAGTLVPYTVRVTDMSSYDFFPGWNKDKSGLEFSNSGHGSTTINKLNGEIGCESCHDPHASDNDRLTALTGSGGSTSTGHLNVTRGNSSTYAEEELCYGCHDDRRSGTCSSSSCHATSMTFLDVSTPISKTYAHPVESSTMAGRHSDTEEGDSGFGTSNRHVECVDCHDPHSAKSGVHSVQSSKHGNVLLGAIGVKPSGSWPTNWGSITSYTTEQMTGESTDYEAYVCFKCHSGYVTLPSSGGSGGFGGTDLVKEFNPNNQSGHNVLGNNVWPKTTTAQGLPYSFGDPDLNLSTSWSSTNNGRGNGMTCSDCHTYDASGARGPHGSGSKFLLDPYGSNQTGDWWNTTLSGWNTSNFLCRKCHTSRTSNTAHSRTGAHGSYTCERCHVRIPHGWKRPRFLRRASTDPAPYNNTSVTGITEIEYKNYTGDIPRDDCEANCGKHAGNVSTPWP